MDMITTFQAILRREIPMLEVRIAIFLLLAFAYLVNKKYSMGKNY